MLSSASYEIGMDTRQFCVNATKEMKRNLYAPHHTGHMTSHQTSFFLTRLATGGGVCHLVELVWLAVTLKVTRRRGTWILSLLTAVLVAVHTTLLIWRFGTGILQMMVDWMRRANRTGYEAVWCDPCRGVRGTGELCRERGLWDTGRPPRVSSLARARGALPGRSTPSSASRGTIEKKTEISSERADAEDSRGPLTEGTRDSVQTEKELGARGPRDEATPGLVGDTGTVAEGDSSELATGGTSAAILGTGETDTSRNSSKRTVGGSGETEQNKRKLDKCQESETSNKDTKKLKATAESDNTSDADASVTKEVDKNGTGVSDLEAETREEKSGSLRVAIVLEGFPEAQMTQEQAEMVEAALVERFDQTDIPRERLQFSAAEYREGALVLTCDNEATETWLYKNAHRLVPWRGARLTVGRADTTLNGTGLEMWVVAHISKRTDEQILDLLQKQNRGLSTVEWKVYSRAVEVDNKVRLTLWVDNKSYAELKARDFLLFLGLSQAKFVPSWEWKKLKTSSTKELTPRNPLQRPTNLLSRRRREQWQTANYTPFKSVSPWLVPPENLSRGTPAANSAYWGALQSGGPWLSDLYPRYHVAGVEDRYWPQSELTAAAYPYFHEAQYTSSDPLLTGVSTESNLWRNYSSRALASEEISELRFDMSGGPQFGEAGHILSEPAQFEDPRYTSDRLQENRYLPSDDWQLLETEYGGLEAPQLRDTIFTVSDRAHIRDSKYVSSNRDKSENSRFGNSNRTPSRVSGYNKLNDTVTETAILQNVTPTIREHGLHKSELPQLQEASISDRARHRKPRYTSESNQSFETVHKDPYPPPLLGTIYTPPYEALSRDSTSVTADRNSSRDSRYATNPDRSENTKFRGSGKPPSRVSRFGDLKKPLPETASLPSLASASLSSGQPKVHGLSVSELPQSREASYGVSDQVRHGTPRYTTERPKKNEYVSSESCKSPETDRRAPYPPPLLGTICTPPYQALSRDSTSVTADRNKSRDSRYVAPNPDRFENRRFGGSGEPQSRDSRFSDLKEPRAETSTLPNLVSAFLSSEQGSMLGLSVSELPQSREASYSVLDQARHGEHRYTSDRSQENKYFTFDNHRGLETVYGAPDLPRLHETAYTALDRAPSRDFESVTANRDESRDSRYVALNRNQSDGMRFRGSDQLLSRVSGFGDLGEPLIETATLHNLASALLTSEQPREHRFGTSELSLEASYSVSDGAKHRESRYTSDRHRDDKYSTSDRHRDDKYSTSDRHRDDKYSTSDRNRDDKYSTSDRNRDDKHSTSDRNRDDKYSTSNRRHKSRDLEYVSPNRDRSENRRVRDSDRALSRVSRFSDLGDEPLTKTATPQIFTSTLLTSVQPHERGFGTSQLTQLREATYLISDRAQRTESEYTSNRYQNNEYLRSDSPQPIETVHVVLDPSQLHAIQYTDSDRALPHDTKYLAAENNRSRDSRYVPPKQEQSIEIRSRDLNRPLSGDSRFRNLDESPVLESIFRSSDKIQSREDSFKEQEYSCGSRSRYPNSQQYRDFGEVESPIRESRFRGLDKIQSIESRFEEQEYPQESNSRLLDSQQYREFDMGESLFRESRYRGSNEIKFRESRFEERENSHESRSRVSDSQQYREFDNTVSCQHSREDRISGSDILPRQSWSPYRSSRHSRTSGSVDYSKTKW